MKKALEDKDKALADAQKVAREKTEAAGKKLAATSKLEEENTKLKQEQADWIKKVEQLSKRRSGVDNYLGDFVKKIIGMLEEFCQDFDKETEEIEPNLDPAKSTIGDVVAMNMFHLDARLGSVQGADVALSLVRVHCKEAKEDKPKALQVANTKKLQFKDFMETFIEAATRIADGIDLDTFIEPASPSGA
ncbi:hypothetical protein ZWY2020_020750 [Hordeum vulgare]|nr:hypothetical protein ZWY2020_020750 [Hordeum vulgare]